MWQFNQSTGQWEWVENPNKKQQGLEQQNIKNIVAQDIGGSSGIEDAVRDNVSRQVFEDLYPEANYDDYFEQKPFNPSDLSTSTSGQVLTGRDAEQYKLYSEKYGQSPYIGADIDDLLGESQSTADKWANGTIKFVGKTATNVIGGLAMFPGLIYGAGTGSFKNVYDNDFQRALDDANEAMDEALPNYVRKEVEDYSIIQKMSTANFWANDVLSGMSFVAGAVLTEMATAGLATPLALSRTLKGLKALQKGSKVDDALKVLSKAKNLRAADNVLGVARKGVTGTFYEAGVESRHFANEAKEQYINNYIEENGYEPSEQEMAEAMSKIYNVANGVFAANSFLVGMGNMATLPKTFGPKLSSRLGKLFNPDKADEIAQGLIKTSDLSKTQLLRTAKKLGKTVAEVKAMNFVERSATRTALENAGRKLYKLGEKPFVEGVWEEMMQGSVNKGALDYVSSYIDDENKLELLDPILSLGRGMAETYGTQEGWEEGVIGMIIGGAGFVGPSSKGKGIGWQGGIWDSLRDPLKTQRAEYLERANSMESPKRIQAFIENGASQYRANREYNEAVQVGDMFTAKSAEHEAFFSDVNFRMKLGDYQRIEDDIAETVDDLTDLEFADMFGYENFTETEIKKRKTELKETLINRARDVKESINEARKIAKTDNEYIQDGLAYSLATIKDVDRREEELARGIADAIGAVDSRSIKNIMQANNRLRFKKGWLDVYNSKLAKLESAKKRLITMNLTGVANQGRINKQQDKINQMQNEISALEQTEFEARKKDGKGVPEYMRDFDAFKKVVEDLSGLIDKVNKHYESNPIAKKSVEGELRDLEKLAQRRETFVGEVNRLITKEGQDSFLESLNKLHEATKKGYIEEEFDRSRLSGLVDPNIDRLILQDIQKKAFESLGLRLKNAGIAIIDSSNIEEALDAEEGAIDNDGFPDDIPNFSDILTTDLAKDWVTKFMDNLPPPFDKSDPIDTKIAKTESKIKYVKEKVKELEDLITNSKGTAIEADYKAIFDSSLLQNGLASLEQTLAKLKERNALVPDGTPVIESASKLGQIYIDSSFVSEEDMEAVDALPKEELWKGIYIKVEDYPEQGKTVPASKNSTVKVTKGIVGMPNKGAYAYININGKEVRIGGVLDPRRFIMSDGTSFNAYNLNHLAELNKAFVETIVNPDSTTDIQVSDAGMQVQNYYVAMSALFKAIEQDNGASNDTIKKLLYTNKSSYFTINTDDLANRPTINEEIPADKDRVTYTYRSLSEGKEKTVQAQIIVRRDRDGSISIFANKDGNWVGLKDSELEAVKALYINALTDNLKKMTGQYVMMLDKPSTGGNYRFLSLGFPSAQTAIDTPEGKQGLLDSIIELIQDQNDKLVEVTKADAKTSRETKDGTGVTLKDENNNDIFLSLLTQNKNEQGKFIPDKNYRVEFTVNKFGKPTVVLSTSVAGAKKIYIDLDIFVKDGKLYTKFGDKSSPITSYSALIDRINKKIKFYSESKYPELLSNGLPYTVGGFFNRVDSVNEEGVLENLGNLRVNATLTRNIYFSPKTKQAASNTRPSGVSAEAAATSNDAYNSFLSDISKLDNDSLKNSAFISQLTLVINDSPVLDNSQKQKLINALTTRVTQVNASAPSSSAPTAPVSDIEAPSVDAALAAMGGQPSNPVAELNEVNNKIADLELDDKSDTDDYRALIAIKAGLQAQIDKSDDGVSPFSISTEDAAELIDLQVAENNLARMLNMRTPQNPNGVFSIDDVRTILSNVRNNGVTWGAFFNNVVYLSKKAGVGTEYHEAFHAVFRTLLSPTQINSYYLAARKQYGNPTAQQLAELKALSSSFSKLTRPELEKLWLEEQMAEGFKSYAVKRDAEKPKGLIGILFDKIKKLLGIVKENKSEIDLLFQDIYTGKFKNARPHNSITNFREPAFVLIPKTTTVINGEISRGYFNKQQTERIINTVASRALQKKTEKGNVTKRDILDIITELATDYYSIQNFRSELKAVKDINPDRYSQIAGKIKQLSESLSLSKTQELIADEVDKRIQIFGIKTSNEAELEDYFDDEVGERNFDQSIAEIGGFGSLSTAMRQFIAFSTEQVDEFGFGEFADLSDKKFTMSSNAFTIYTGVERVLANTAAKDMLPKLKVFAENNPSARAFFNHLTTNINMELEKKGFNNFDSKENFDILLLSQSSLFSAFASAFSKNRVPQVVVVFDPNSKQLKAYRSNIKDDSLVQITEWQRAFTNSGRDRQDKKADNVAALESLESIFNDSTLGAPGPKPVPNEADLNNNITKIQQEFLKIGVSVSKGYVKHSLIQKHEKEIIAAIDNENVNADFLRGLMEEYYLFKDVKGLANDDIKGIKTSIFQSNNPYQKTQVVEKEAEEDTASIGRLKAIATSNSVFDETVSAVTFQNSEGKDIYTYVQPSYLTSETEKWKKRATTAVDLFEAVRENKSDKEGAEIIMSMMQMEGTPYQYYLAKNMYQTIKHNPFILGIELDPNSDNIVENEEFAIELFKNIQSYIIDGMRVASLSGEDVEGETRYFEEAFKGSFGTSYGKMDGKSKFIQALSFFSGTPDNTLRKKFRFPGAIDSQGKFVSSKEREAAPIIVGVNEAKNTQNAVQLPVQNFVDGNGQINNLGVEYIIRAFLQEYYRIGNVQKEAAAIQAGELIDGHEVYDIEDYHYAIDEETDKKDYTKGKGHDFFQFKSFKNLNPDLYVELLNAAKKGTSLSQDHRAALEFLIKEKYAPDLFSKFLGKLSNTKNNLIVIQAEETSSEEGREVKYINKMLPSYYEYSDTKEVNMQSLGMFFFNDMINSMTYNMLVNGDYAMLFKNPTDVVKRNSRLIAAGPSLGTGVSRVAIVKSVKAKDRYDKDTVPQSDIKDLGEQDTTDAQNLGTLNWYRSKYLTSTGKLTPQVEEIYNKIEKGYRLNEAEVRILKKNNALVNPRKIVGVNRYFYDKTSIKTLLRSESSYILKQDRARADELYDRLFEARSKGQVETVRSIYEELHTLWKPIPSERANHDLLNKLELDNIDILIFDSAIKTMKANVGSVTGNNENGFTWELSPIEVDDESFREQVKTDTMKSSIVDPTQTLNTVFSEQRSATKTSVLGKQTTVGNAAQAFESLVAERSKRGFLEMRKSILSGDTPRYKYLLKMFKENLMATGADPYLIEMVSESITNADMPQFNLNMPATISKLESMFLSYLSKNTLKVKAPGHKMTLISDFGSGVNMYKGNIVTAAEIQNNPEKYAKEVTTRKLQYRKDNKGNFYTEIKISAQFAEHLGIRPGDNIPSELLEMFGVRIPTQDKHSMGYFKVVDYLPMETGNQIMLPFEILKLSGADFDVDAEYLRSFDFFTLNDKPHWFGQYLKNSKPKDALEQARQEYIRENSANKEVAERITEELKNNKDYQRLKDDLSALQKSIKLRKKFLNNLDSEIRAEFQEEIDELENILTQAFGRDDLVDDDTSTPSSDTLASLDAKEIEKAGLAAFFRQITLEDDISNTIDVRKRQILKKLTALKKQTTDAKNAIREIENRNTIESLEKLGYPASEEKFDRKYGKQVLDNRAAYGKGDFEKINPITIAEINNLLIPITGSLIYNQTNEKIGNTITSVDAFDALEKTLGFVRIVDNTILEGVHDATSKNDAAVSNDTGKENIGPAAVFNLMFQRLHKYGISFNKEYIENNEQFVEELAESFSLRVGNDGSILNSQGVRVNELIDQVISAMTDNGKDPKAARFNLSYQTLGATLLRLGLGEGFDLAILTQKLPIMEQVVSEIQADASDLTEIKIGKIKVIASILAKLAKLPMAEDGIDFSESNLIQAIKYGQDPSQSSLNEEEFNYIQYAAVLRMGNSIIVSDYLRNLSDIIGLARGLKPTFSENYNIRNSLKNLGLEVVLKEKGNLDNPDDYIIQHIKGVYDPSMMPMDVLPILNQDKIVRTNVVLFHMMMNDSGKFFVLETPMGQKLIQKAGVSFKNSFLGYKDNITNMRTALLSYLSMRAYRKRTGKGGLDPNNLFRSNLVDLHTKLLQNPDFANNDLLNALVPQEIKFTEKNRSGLAGKTLYKLSFNTRTKNNPDYVERLIDSFKALSLSNNPEAKAFAQEAFMYLMMKDGGLFKSDTFIRQIAPVFLGNISEGLNSVQELFSGNSNLSYEGVFGVSEAQLIQEFVELFARYTPNNFSLRGGKLSAILSTNYIAEDIRDLKESLKGSQQYSDQEIRDILKNRFPIYRDPETRIMTLNIYRGIDENTPTDERNKIMGINAYVLKKTGLVSKNEQDKIVYPPIFQVTDQGGAKILYKLKYLQKGTFIKQDKNTGAIISDATYTLDADTQNLYAEEMIGLGAVYEEVSPILDKAIVPWFWKLNELDTFIEFSKLQQPEEASAVSREAEESAPQLTAAQQEIINKLANVGFPQTREGVAAATPVVTATPTKEESGTVSSDSLLGGMAGLRQKMKEKGVSQAVKDRVRNMGSKLKPSDTMESKSSAKQPINQAALTNILDKLALKFGISWRYDSSIPGLGQFKDGEVLINPDKAKADTPFHEFAHPFIAIVKIQNPYLYNNLMNQLTKSDVGIKTLEKVKKLYPELTYEQQIEEAIVDVIGQYAADAQSIKKEKGLWNAIKTFLRRVSEYIKSLLNDSQKKIVPSELDPNTTMKELASMLVIDNPIDLGPLLSRSYKKTTTIKPGVQELFESNPELANAVYEAAGLINTSEIQLDKPRFNPDNYEAISYSVKINGEYAGVVSVDKDGYISSSIGMAGVELEKEFQGKGYGTKVYIALAEQLAKEGKTLKSEAFGKGNINESANRVWKSLLNKGYAVDKGSYFEIQLKNKQQALQLYSQYLDTIFPDSQVKDIVYKGGKGGISEEQYYTLQKNYAERYGKTIPVILNLPNPVISDKGIHRSWIKDELTDRGIIGKDYPGSTSDAVIEQMNGDEPFSAKGQFDVYVIKNENQKHVLGSNTDIKGFKEFTNQSTRPQLNNVSTLFNTFANVSDADVLELINECN